MAVFAFVEFPTVQAAADWMVSQQVDNIDHNTYFTLTVMIVSDSSEELWERIGALEISFIHVV